MGENRAEIGSGSGILIDAGIEETRRISKNKWQWARALAGRARFLVEVTIETFEAEGESSGGSALAGTTDEAIERAAEGVVLKWPKINEQTAE